MPRFAGVPVEQTTTRKPRFAGVPVAKPMPTAQPTADTTGLALPGTENTTPYVEPTLVDRIMGVVDGARGAAYQGGVGVSKGVTNILGLPGLVGDVLPDGVPFAQTLKMLPTGNEMQEFFRLDQAPEARNPLETVTGRVGEEVGAMLVPVGGVAAKAVQMGVPAIRQAGGFVQYLLEQMALNPAKAIGKETTAAVGAGTGAGIANTMVDRDTAQGQMADLGGAFTGAGVVGLGSHLLKSLGNIAGAIFQNPNYVDEAVNTEVVDRISKAAGLPGTETAKGVYNTDPLVEQIMGGPANRPSQVIPGFEESLADRTQNPGIASLEYSRQAGPNAGAFTQRRSQNTEAVDQVMENAAPKETPGAFRSALETERDARLGAAADTTGAAQSEFERYIQTLTPQMDAESRGAAVRGGVANAERIGREMESSVWQGIEGQVDPAPLADALDQTREGLTLARQQSVQGAAQTIDIPRQLSTPAGDIPAGPVDVQELNDVRSALLTQQRAAQTQGDRNQVEALGRFIEDINGYLGSDAVDPAVRAQTEGARAVSRDVNERFNRPNDPLARVLSTSEGRPDLPDSAVAKSFIQPDTAQASNIDRLLAETDLTSHGRTVREALSDEIVAGIDKGKMAGDPARLDEYLNQFGRVFDRFPDLRTEIRNAAEAGRGFDTARTAETNLQRDLGTPDGTVKPRGAVGKYLTYEDGQSERAISEVLASKNPGAATDELMGFIGDNNPRAVEGARAAFWQKLKSESQSVDNSQRAMGGARAWRGDWMKSFLNRPGTRAVAERLYRDNPEQLAALDLYADVLDNVDLRQRGKAAGTSGTAQGVNPVLTPETLQSRAYAYLSGRISGTYLVTSIAAVFARRAVRRAQTEAIERLTDKVLLNPDLAAEMLKENNPANRAALNRKAKGWLGNEAATFLEIMDGDEDTKPAEDDPVVAAAMEGRT